MATKKFLDLNGLLYFWNKVKTYVDNAGNYNSFSSEQLNGISEGTTWEIIGYNADGIPTVPHTAVAGG